MRHCLPVVLGCLGMLAGGVASIASEENPTLLEAITKGSPTLSFRYRYENVDDDAFDKEAHASTLRTALGYKTLAWKGLGLYAEAENVTTIGNDLYDNAGAGSLNNGVTDRPVVADPAITDVNQVYGWFDRGGTNLLLGRENLAIDDERYVGPVAWRQHYQSFDTFHFTNTTLDWARFFYGYVDKVHRINGATWDTSSQLINFRFTPIEAVRVTPYAYLLDFENPGQYGLSTATYGLELIGKHKLGEHRSINWEAEYATQGDYGGNPGRISAEYLFLMIGGSFKPLNVTLGYEVLSGSESDGQFSTPLATLHKFNGWADKFLTTPTDGLKDLYLSLDGALGPAKWLVAYHDFSAENGQATTGAEYGDELDFQVLYTAPWKQGFGLAGAMYFADEFSTDTNKYWLFTTFKI